MSEDAARLYLATPALRAAGDFAPLLASALSAALTYGPVHAWGWISPEVFMGLVWALVGAAVLSLCPPRLCWVLALAALVLQLSLLNSASADVYFSLTLQTWEQGRFIRFHGLIQWLGWLWLPRLLHAR